MKDFDFLEIYRVNVLATISVIFSYVDLTEILTIMVLLTTVIYNGIKIYQAMKNKSQTKGTK